MSDYGVTVPYPVRTGSIWKLWFWNATFEKKYAIFAWRSNSRFTRNSVKPRGPVLDETFVSNFQNFWKNLYIQTSRFVKIKFSLSNYWNLYQIVYNLQTADPCHGEFFLDILSMLFFPIYKTGHVTSIVQFTKTEVSRVLVNWSF